MPMHWLIDRKLIEASDRENVKLSLLIELEDKEIKDETRKAKGSGGEYIAKQKKNV